MVGKVLGPDKDYVLINLMLNYDRLGEQFLHGLLEHLVCPVLLCLVERPVNWSKGRVKQMTEVKGLNRCKQESLVSQPVHSVLKDREILDAESCLLAPRIQSMFLVSEFFDLDAFPWSNRIIGIMESVHKLLKWIGK